MIDINSEAKKTLDSLSIKNVFGYPHNFEKIPIISYYTVTECGGMYSDNSECIQEGHIQLDIWARVAKDTSNAAIEVNRAMTDDGWIREMSLDVPDGDERLYHKTMRYKKYFML